MKPMHCSLITPQKTLYDGEVWQIGISNVPEGGFSIRTGHAPVIRSLLDATIEVAVTQSDRSRYEVENGVLELSDNRCSIVCSSAELLK